MTLDELLAREAIRDTLDTYTMATDEYDAETHIRCFADDAILEFDPFPGKGYFRLEGRQAIYEFTSGFFGSLKRGEITLPGKFQHHHITSTQIKLLGADTAWTKSYCLIADINGVQHSAIYTGHLRRVGERWLISNRKWTLNR